MSDLKIGNLKIGGKILRCECGGNLFRPSTTEPHVFICVACEDEIQFVSAEDLKEKN